MNNFNDTINTSHILEEILASDGNIYIKIIKKISAVKSRHFLAIMYKVSELKVDGDLREYSSLPKRGSIISLFNIRETSISFLSQNFHEDTSSIQSNFYHMFGKSTHISWINS